MLPLTVVIVNRTVGWREDMQEGPTGKERWDITRYDLLGLMRVEHCASHLNCGLTLSSETLSIVIPEMATWMLCVFCYKIIDEEIVGYVLIKSLLYGLFNKLVYNLVPGKTVVSEGL